MRHVGMTGIRVGMRACMHMHSYAQGYIVFMLIMSTHTPVQFRSKEGKKHPKHVMRNSSVHTYHTLVRCG